MAETLNLVNPNDPLSFEYKISRFPDGQQSIQLIESGYNTFYSLQKNDNGIIIKSRLNNFLDLELIICATQALRGLGVKKIILYVPYFIGGRSDRKFLEGGVNYIKQVIAPIINSQNYDEVRILDPHSDVLEACINNFVKISNSSLLFFALKDYFVNIKGINEIDTKKILLLSPDAGALKKIYEVAKNIGYKSEIVTALKYRNPETGQIEKTNVPLNISYGDVLEKDIFIVDDICDGGKTFIEVAKVIKSDKRFIGKIYLIVSHGIFSNGFDELNQYFDRIYTTNSVQDIQDGILVDTFSENKTILSLVKQLNVF